nr:hypothetical protein [Candidatus Nitrosopumilus sp. SW]
MQCRGTCLQLKTNHITTSQKYEKGQKRCTLCAVFMETINIRCPCCNAKLRTRARSNKKRKN